MSYQVHLDVFEGPFDLLLKLISRRKVDVTEVDLAEITADFLSHLTDLEDLDLETATRFLVVAATLVELKAARLLPAEEQEELDDLLGEARDLLYARLLEYRAFRDVAGLLERRHEVHGRYWPREVGLESRFQRLVPDAPLETSVTELARLAARATAPRPEPHIDLEHIRHSYMALRDAAQQVLEALGDGAGDGSDFANLVRGRDRGDRVVLFLAVLELYKLGHLSLEQATFDAPLRLAKREGGQSLDVVLDDYDAPSAEDDEPAAEPADGSELTGAGVTPGEAP
ncbi:MAG: ScpA family protein [Nitriliruptorales bacterium]|nr:ScpA family protein [Nitriliruptorales bacterium]